MSDKKTLDEVIGGERNEAKELSEQTKKDITEFLADHKEMVVIILDPETDTIVAGHKDTLIPVRTVDKDTGAGSGMIKDVLKYDIKDGKVVESIKHILSMLDGMFYNIVKRSEKL